MGKITARIHQSAETHDRQNGRQHINLRTADVAQIDRQIFAHQQHRRQHKRRGKAEQHAPMRVVNNDARQRRPHRGRSGKHHGNHAHRCSALIGRVNRQNAVKQERNEKRGRHRLHHPTDYQYAKSRRKRANHRTGQKRCLRKQHHFARFKPLNHACRNRRKCTHDQQKTRRQPLNRGLIDPEILHNRRKRDIQQRVVEIAEKCADKQRRHNGFSRKVGIVGVVFVCRCVLLRIRSVHNNLKYQRNRYFSINRFDRPSETLTASPDNTKI